jgi:hypothetical protein
MDFLKWRFQLLITSQIFFSIYEVFPLPGAGLSIVCGCLVLRTAHGVLRN